MIIILFYYCSSTVRERENDESYLISDNIAMLDKSALCSKYGIKLLKNKTSLILQASSDEAITMEARVPLPCPMCPMDDNQAIQLFYIVYY